MTDSSNTQAHHIDGPANALAVTLTATASALAVLSVMLLVTTGFFDGIFSRVNVSAWSTFAPLKVKVTGKDFRWHFQYAGPDGRFETADDILSDNELHVPNGRPLELAITSEDYVYLFTVPGVGQRQIAVPEMLHPAEFSAGSLGRHEMIVDPMCGWAAYHTGPMGWLVVEGERDFIRWLRAA